MLDLDARAMRRAAELDRDVGPMLRVGGDVPPIAQASWRVPLHDLAPLDLVAVGGALEDAPAHARLEHDARAALVRHGVLRRPPRRGLAGPRLEGMVGAALDVELDAQRLDHRRLGLVVFSAKSLKRVATSLHTRVRYSRSRR